MPYKNKEDRNAARAARKERLKAEDPAAYETLMQKQRDAVNNHYQANKETLKVKHREWWDKHPGKGREYKHAQGTHIPMDHYKKILSGIKKIKDSRNPVLDQSLEVARERTKRNIKVYGLDIDVYEKMYDEQSGGCAICYKEHPIHGKGRLHVDHCHKTGNVRQLLCMMCNAFLGSACDSVEILQRGIAYLEKHGSNG